MPTLEEKFKSLENLLSFKFPNGASFSTSSVENLKNIILSSNRDVKDEEAEALAKSWDSALSLWFKAGLSEDVVKIYERGFNANT